MNIPSSHQAGPPRAYGAYGEGPTLDLARTAYAGEVLEHDSGWYLLGERPYAPLQRRFLATDPTSPFGGGGFNRYAYCVGDPINRVDPTGSVSIRWWAGGAGDRVRMRGGSQQSSLGATTGASLSLSIATPGMSTQVAASNIDLVPSVGVAAGSRVQSARPSQGVLGQLAPGSPSSASTALTPPTRSLHDEPFFGRMPTISHEKAPGRTSRRVTQVVGDAIPPDMIEQTRYGTTRVTEGWIGLPHRRNPASTIWASDTAIVATYLRRLIGELSTRGVTRANLFTGAHGDPEGKRNWSRTTRRRRMRESEFYLHDLNTESELARDNHGIELDVYDMAMMDREEFRATLAQDGIHIIGCCFGAADREVMAALNIWQLTVYVLPSSRPPT